MVAQQTAPLHKMAQVYYFLANQACGKKLREAVGQVYLASYFHLQEKQYLALLVHTGPLITL
jgi:hypothetical protein